MVAVFLGAVISPAQVTAPVVPLVFALIIFRGVEAMPRFWLGRAVAGATYDADAVYFWWGYRYTRVT